jgi:DNA polymerase I-like protein with 3'-5' exonuclease and polymerase domains
MSEADVLKRPKYKLINKQEGLKKVYENLKNEKVIALDTETTGIDPFTSTLILFQIGSRDYSYVIEARDINDWTLIKKLCEDESKLKILQNCKFDYKMVKQKLDIELNNMYDTYIAESLIVCGLPRNENGRGLGYLTQKYLGSALEKEVRKSFLSFKGGRVTEKQAEYAALDIIVLFGIFDKQYPILQKQDLLRVAKLEFKVAPVVGDMELRGFNIDVDKWRKHIDVLREQREKVAAKLQEAARPYYKISSMDLFGNHADVINLNSQIQLMELFNDKLGLDLQSTGVAVLESTDHPIAKLMLEYRQYEKLISAFGESLLEKVNPVTKRLHPDYSQMGTFTGRFACANPNLQQIPAHGDGAVFRTFFGAPPGKSLVTVDYSQQEMRVLADFSKDPTLLDSYKTGKDLHSLTAAKMFNVPYTDDFKDKHGDLRFQAKSINFGLVYGRGATSLAGQLGVTPDEAVQLVEKYFKEMPQIGTWLENSAKHGVEKGFVETSLGRKRYFVPPDPADPNFNKQKSSIERASKNMPIQGTSADMTKYAMVLIDKEYKKQGIKGGMIHTLHDEIVSEVPDDQAELAMQIQHGKMVEAGETFLKDCPVGADGEISKQWEH